MITHEHKHLLIKHHDNVINMDEIQSKIQIHVNKQVCRKKLYLVINSL